MDRARAYVITLCVVSSFAASFAFPHRISAQRDAVEKAVSADASAWRYDPSASSRRVRRRLVGAGFGTAMGGLVLPGAATAMFAASFAANPLCLTFADEPNEACEARGGIDREVIGLSVLAGVGFLTSITLFVSQPIIIHRTRRERRTLEALRVGVMLPDAREPAMRLVLRGSF